MRNNMSLKDTDVRTPGNQAIAKKFKLSLAKVRQLVKVGADHEKEHNTNLAKAKEVARDHIGERPDYYKMLKKAEKTPVSMKEETGTGGVRGLGYITGDPGIDPVSQYINTNAMYYEDENGNKLAYIKKAHADLHNAGLGYNFFDPTKIKTLSNRELTEAKVKVNAKLNELGELDKSGAEDYKNVSAPRSTRANDQLEEGPKLDKAKRVAMAGMTAANIYTMGDVMSKATSGHGSPKGDVVRMASTLPGAAGWGATGIHYAKKAYDLVKGKKMEEQRGDKPAQMSDATERGIYQEGYASIGHSFDWAGDVNRRAKFYGKKPKPTTTKNDEKDDTYKDSKQGGKVKFAKTVKEDWQSELEHPDFIHTVSREANLKDPKSIDAVLHVMHNRMGAKGYGSSPLGVVRQKGQFAAYGKGPAKGFNDEHKSNIISRAKAIFGGQEKDITGGANEFRTTSAKNRPGGTQIGGNTFYKTGSFAKATPKAPAPTQVAAAPKPEAPKPTQVAAATPSSSGSYSIQKGDTLSGLAKKYGTDVGSLAKSSGISDPNKLSVGQSIKVPEKPTQVAMREDKQTKALKKAVANKKLKDIKGKKKSQELINKLVKMKNLEEDWQSVNRKDKTDGLSQKAVDAYKRENPGSKLQTAVTEKNPTGKRASRRKSFCSRMGGMKKRLTSAKTARDPDSRINKALRRWNCEESVINELTPLNPQNLGTYISNAAKSRKVALKDGGNVDIKTWGKRNKGIERAYKKLTGTSKNTNEETKMDNKDTIQEAFDNILENKLDNMRENFQAILQEKAMEKLEERKKEIAANYFAQ